MPVSDLLRPVAALSVVGMLFVPVSALAASDAETLALVEALSLNEVMAILRDEGIAYGAELEQEMFPGQGGKDWAAVVEGIYAQDRVMPMFIERLGDELDRVGADVPAMTEFFTSDTGRKAVALELSARRALLDEAVEEAALVKLEERRAANDPRVADVDRFIEVNDLIEANVTGGLNASLAFYRGMSEAGAFPDPLPEDEMLSEVWGQEPEIRAETEEWMASFLLMAYAPLSDSELGAYTDFSGSRAGDQLNAALFAGFDAVFTDVSYRLGRSVATYVAGENL